MLFAKHIDVQVIFFFQKIIFLAIGKKNVCKGSNCLEIGCSQSDESVVHACWPRGLAKRYILQGYASHPLKTFLSSMAFNWKDK